MTKENYVKMLISNKGHNIKSFAREIDIPYTTLSGILKRGIDGASVQNVIKICKALNITVEALQNVENNNHTSEDNNLLSQLIKKYNLTKDAANFMKTFLMLDAQDRETMIKCMTLLTQHTADIIPKQTKPDHKLTPAEKRRIVNSEIDQEEKATTSSASTGTNGM